MSRIMPLQAGADQQFTVVLDNNEWNFTIKEAKGIMAVSISRNGETLISNVRAVAAMRLLGSLYQEQGNFIFTTLNNELPDYKMFGTSQFLVYYSPEELEEIRTPLPFPITAADFDPTGGLPLRFKPQGYTLA